MGTSVQIIQEHYGHINPVKNADRILLGSHTWEIEESAEEAVAEGEAGKAVEIDGKAKTKARAPKRKRPK